MILHLGAGGVPISWAITALYRDSYGIAHNSAKSWYDRIMSDRQTDPGSSRSGQPDSPQFVIEIERDGDGPEWVVKRSDLFMDRYHLKNQTHDRPRYLLQEHTSPVEIPGGAFNAVHRGLYEALVAFGYVIPMEDWERRYPSRVIVSDHFAAFNRAYDEHRASGLPGDLPFELRWSPFMEAPDGFVFPYGVTETEGGWTVTQNGRASPEAPAFTEEDAQSRKRLLNSGYTSEQVEILMRQEPIEDGTP